MAKKKRVPKTLGHRANTSDGGYRGGYQKGHKKMGGRKKGTPNRITGMAEFRAAMWQYPEIHGYDGKGKDGVLGACAFLFKKCPQVYLQCLVRQMPLEANVTVRGAMAVIATHVSEKEAAEAYNSMLEDNRPLPSLERSKDGTFVVAKHA